MARTRADQVRRSKQPWERGRGAKKKGNPRYKKVRRRDKNGVMRNVYIIRHPTKKDRKRRRR